VAATSYIGPRVADKAKWASGGPLPRAWKPRGTGTRSAPPTRRS